MRVPCVRRIRSHEPLGGSGVWDAPAENGESAASPVATVLLARPGLGTNTKVRVRTVVYAVVRAGGRQEKVEVGTVVTMDRVKTENGTVELPAVLLVDGDNITSDAQSLAKVKVTAEVLGNLRGKKIVIQKFKNKTGYKKRQGHRQDLTRVKITGIK